VVTGPKEAAQPGEAVAGTTSRTGNFLAPTSHLKMATWPAGPPRLCQLSDP